MTTSPSLHGVKSAPPVVSGKDAGKIARAAFVGTALEWYDYYLFGTAAALVFNRLFFTDLDPTAALLASVLLRRRNRVYRRLYEEEERDDNADGIPDIYQARTR